MHRTLVVMAAAVGGEGAIDERALVPIMPDVVAPAGVGEGAVCACASVLPTPAIVVPAGDGEEADAPVVATCTVVGLEGTDAVLEDGGAPLDGGEDVTSMGVVLILASLSSIFCNNPSILFERTSMVADAGSAVVEGGRAIALPNAAALGSNLANKMVESEELAIWRKIWGIPKNLTLITNCYGRRSPNHNSKSI